MIRRCAPRATEPSSLSLYIDYTPYFPVHMLYAIHEWLEREKKPVVDENALGPESYRRSLLQFTRNRASPPFNIPRILFFASALLVTLRE
jgi:hypothetical protein